MVTKRKMTLEAAEKKAARYIEQGHSLAYDVCATYGQIFENVCHMVWFRDLLAAQILKDYNCGSIGD